MSWGGGARTPLSPVPVSPGPARRAAAGTPTEGVCQCLSGVALVWRGGSWHPGAQPQNPPPPQPAPLISVSGPEQDRWREPTRG